MERVQRSLLRSSHCKSGSYGAKFCGRYLRDLWPAVRWRRTFFSFFLDEGSASLATATRALCAGLMADHVRSALGAVWGMAGGWPAHSVEARIHLPKKGRKDWRKGPRRIVACCSTMQRGGEHAGREGAQQKEGQEVWERSTRSCASEHNDSLPRLMDRFKQCSAVWHTWK